MSGANPMASSSDTRLVSASPSGPWARPQVQLLLDLGLQPPPSLSNFVTGRNHALVLMLQGLIERYRHDQPESANVGNDHVHERMLYIWGAPGAGRSHLLQAVAYELDLPIIGVHEAAALPQSSDGLWLLDDVDQLTPDGQHALFNLFNALQAGGGGLIVTGPCAPRQLPVREDLRTRMGLMHVFELQELSDAEKIQTLRNRVHQRGIHLSDEVLHYLMTRMPRDMRSLADWIDALDAWSLERHRPVTIPMVREILSKVIAAQQHVATQTSESAPSPLAIRLAVDQTDWHPRTEA